MDKLLVEKLIGRSTPLSGKRAVPSAPLMILLGAALLMAFAIASGRPVIYSDTRSYYELGEQIAETIKIVRPQPLHVSGGLPTAAMAAEARDPRLALTMAGARSPSYAFFFYLVQHFLSAWGVVALQAMAMSIAVFILLGGIGRTSDFVWIILGLSFLSSLPILVDFLMPDIFTALAATSLFYVIAAKKITRLFGGVMVGALAFSLSAHLSNVPITVPVALLGLGSVWILRLSTRGDILRRAGIIAVAIVTAVSASLAYSAAVRILKHDALRSPPFLTARLLQDGPGRRYLSKACEERTAFVLCHYKALPLDNSNDVLWSFNPHVGVLELADYDTRIGLIKEQPRFVIGTFRFDPLGTAASALRNVWIELTSYKADESYADPAIYYSNPAFSLFSQILPGGRICLAAPHACAPHLSLAMIDAIMLAGSIISLITIAILIRPALAYGQRSAIVALLSLGFFFFNACVCGVLSGPAERYQTRVEWLLPFSALLLATSIRRKGPSNEGD